MEGKDSLLELIGGLSKAIKEAEEKYVFENKFNFPMEIKGIKKSRRFISEDRSCEVGSLVKIRPCGEEYQGKTYVGIFLGNLAIDNACRLNRETNELEIIPYTNPAIFVPDLKRIVFGCESWWGKINSVDEVKDITDEDIENLWYVKLLKSMESDTKNRGSGVKGMSNKEVVASEHYEGLKNLSDKPQYSSIKEILPSKEEFIKNYPVSTIGIVSIRKFWEVCLSVGIVKSSFYEDNNKFNPLEKELYDLCCNYMYSGEEDYNENEFRTDIKKLFERYEI